MIAALLVGTLGLAALPGEGRAHLARIHLEGPLESVRLVVEPMGETLIEGPLLAGERRRLEVPVPLWAPPGGVEPELIPTGGGRASFEGWVDPLGEDLGRAWLAVPAGLRARARLPDPERTPPRAPPLALLTALSGFVLLVSQRRRPARAAAIGLLAAALTAAATLRAGAVTAHTRVLEGDAGTDRWIAVDAARGELALPAELPLRVESRPARARLVWRVPLLGTTGWLGREPRPTWILEGGATLTAVTRFEPASALEPTQNGWGDFERTWTRAPGDAGWLASGPWALGTPLPGGGAGAPPGWLAAGLPQGQGVFAGRLAASVLTGAPSRGGPGAQVWVRLTGFPGGGSARESGGGH